MDSSTNSCTDIQQHAVPLLLQRPSYARSKSLIHDDLRKFHISLKWCALDHSSFAGKFISYFVFTVFTIIVPIVTSMSVHVPASSHAHDPLSFNKLVQLPESGLAAIGFFTLCSFFRRYGLRQLLFLDVLQDDSQYVRRGYTRELDKAFKFLACILFPSFFVELAHKIIFFSNVVVSVPFSGGLGLGMLPLSSVMFVAGLASWVYRTGLFLLVCVLFRLTCELQILRFEGLQKWFDGCESDGGVIFREHLRIRKQLSVTSHRYRFFIIGCMVTISVSQLGALLLVLASRSEKTFFNSGDLVVCSVVQISGFILCILGAARITHRAQGIVSVATRWHVLVTIATARLEMQLKGHMPEASDGDSLLIADCGDSDSDSSDIFVTVCSQDLSSYHTRQALVKYMQHNCGGITLYGFALDRGLLHTLFAFEFSLVLWILSKVVVLD